MSKKQKNLVWQYIQPIIIPYLILALGSIPMRFINPLNLGTKPWHILIYIPWTLSFVYIIFIGLFYCPFHIPSTYFSLIKQRKEKPNIFDVLNKSLLAVLIIFLPVLIVYFLTCGIKKGCDMGEPTSGTALLVFFLLLNLITVTISAFILLRIRKKN